MMITPLRKRTIISRFYWLHRRKIIRYKRTFEPFEYSCFVKNRNLIGLVAFVIFTIICITIGTVTVVVESPTSKNHTSVCTFKPTVQYPIGFDSRPWDIAIADLDGDKHLDLIVANSGSDTIGIFFGYGNASFTDQINYPTGLHSTPLSVDVADFNKDGAFDIVVAKYNTHEIGVFLNYGYGKFRDQMTYSLGSARPVALAIGDFNNDNQSDIVVGNRGTFNIAILFGFENGSFELQPFIDMGYDSYPCALKVADFNDDTHDDIAVVDQELSNLIVLLATDSGNFFNYTYSTGNNAAPNSLTVGDLNNDNIMDIAVANYVLGTIVIFLGFGDGTFQNAMIHKVGINPFASLIVSGNFDNDKNLDLIVANSKTQTITLLKGYGNGSFSLANTHTLGPNSVPTSMIVGDFDESSPLDIAITTYGTNNVVILTSYSTNVYIEEWMYSTGVESTPESIQVGDFNKDNLLDIVVPNTLTSSISIFLGLGNGNFSDQTVYFLRNGSQPSSVAVGDFNNDKNLDFVVGSTNISEIIIYLGNGDGTFKAGNSYTLESPYPFSVDVSDFNTDNNLDIITAVYGMNSSGIFLGHGDGTFTIMTTYLPKLDTLGNTVSVGDFNNDTKPDFAIIYFQQSMANIYLGDGNGSFHISMIIPINDGCPIDLTVGDVNNDNRLDLIIAAPCSATINILFGYGNGTFGNLKKYSTGTGSFPCAVTAGHFNNDSNLDIAVANEWSFSFSIFIGYGNGTFGRPFNFLIRDSLLPFAIIFGDLNNQGKSSVIITTSSTNNVHVYLAYYKTDFTNQKPLSTGSRPHPSSVAVGDFDKDTQLDIAVTNSGNNNVQVFLDYKSRKFLNQTTYSTGSGSNPIYVVTVDIDKDSQLDIIVANTWKDNIYVFFGVDNGTFDEPTIHSTGYSSQPYAIAFGNFKNYGWIDVVVANSGTDNIGIFLGFNYPTFYNYSIHLNTRFIVPAYAIAADFNNDHLLDMAVSATNDNSIYILLGSGNNTFLNPIAYTTGANPVPLVAGDFNNDKQLDIAVGNVGGSSISILLNYGNGTFARNIQYSTGSTPPLSIAVGDFNQDNNLDIAVANTYSDSIGIFIGRGNGIFDEQILNRMPAGSQPIFVAVSDLNNDRILDIVVINANAKEVGILLGYGNGYFQNVTRFSTRSNSDPRSLSIGDLNQDGFMDIAVTSENSGSIGLFYGYGNGTFSWQTTLSVSPQSNLIVVIITDLNQDNIADIITLDASGGNSSINAFFGYGHGKFAMLKNYPVGSSMAALSFIVADLNNDNRSDLVVVVPTYVNIVLMFQDDNTPFSKQITYSTGSDSNPVGVNVADLNNDGQLDIAVANYQSSNVGIFLGHGDGTFDQQKTYFTGRSSQPSSIVIDDFNDDKKLDIAITDIAMDSLIIIFGSGDGSFSAMKTYSTGTSSSPRSLAVADLNNDNRLDIVVANQGTNKILVFYGSDNGTFKNPDSYSVYYNSKPQSVAIGDFNNDSRLDFAVANNGQDYVEIFLQTC